MNSTGKKRRESPSSSSTDYKVVGDPEASPPVTKKPRTSLQESEQNEPHSTETNLSSALSDRTPLKVNLKRIGKREHGAVETPLRLSTDDELAAPEAESYVSGGNTSPWAGAVVPPPRKLAALASSFPSTSATSLASPAHGGHSPSQPRSKQASMATNLRASLRGSNGGVGQKQVKKLVIKSSLGTCKETCRTQEKSPQSPRNSASISALLHLLGPQILTLLH
jgi:hypothetical protein